jgi:hypothetical protein
VAERTTKTECSFGVVIGNRVSRQRLRSFPDVRRLRLLVVRGNVTVLVARPTIRALHRLLTRTGRGGVAVMVRRGLLRK